MKQIIPMILNPNFEMIGALDDYKTLIWTTRYWSCGDFEITMPPKRKDLIAYGNYVYREDDPRVGMIEYIELNVTEDGEEVMLVKGRFLESILARRIVPQITNLTGTPGKIITDVVNQNLTVAGSGSVYRGIPNFQVSPVTTGGTSVEVQAEMGVNLLEFVSAQAEQYELGFKVELQDVGGQMFFVFSVFKGVDRSYNQSANTYVIYSEEYDNLLTSTYIEDYQSLVTSALAGGEGEGTDRVTSWSDTDLTIPPLYRYETFVDAQSSSSELVQYSVYLQQLKNEANQQKTQTAQSFGGTVNFESYKWNEDVFIGDVVEIENKRWGVSIHARIIEVIESISESGEYSLIPTFAF